VQPLLDLGACAVFPTGTPIEALVEAVRRLTSEDASPGENARERA
jgi:hypothetical protein